MAILNSFVIRSFGPRGVTVAAKEKWEDTLAGAEDVVRRRLGVKRLHKSARIATKMYPGAMTKWSKNGLEWRSIYVIEYRNVPQSHADFERSGGCVIHQVSAVSESKLLDVNSLFPAKKK